MSKQEKSRKIPVSCGRIECESARAQCEMQANACTHRYAKNHRAKVIAILLVCILTLFLSSCNKGAVTNASEDAREWDISAIHTGNELSEEVQSDSLDNTAKAEQDYRWEDVRVCRVDERLRFSVPFDWEPFMESDGDVSFDFENGFFEAKRFSKELETTDEDALDSVLMVWSDQYDVHLREKRTVNGYEAVYEQIEQPLSGYLVVQCETAVIDTGDRYYVLYLQNGNGEKQKWEGLFDKLLESVRIEDTDLSNAQEQISSESKDIQTEGFSLQSVPAYHDKPVVEVNGNVPYFQEKEFTATAFKKFSMLDELGRCGVVTACLGPETMPTEPRESIGMIKPSGWHTVKYDGIDGNFLYNRCHLIGYQLCGENANELNLITGTRYMNTQGMEPFESDTAYYIKRTGNHVLYRVTPIFAGNDLVATGVLMEARSVEEDDFAFCIFCYNVQPGIVIDYSTGESWLSS